MVRLKIINIKKKRKTYKLILAQSTAVFMIVTPFRHYRISLDAQFYQSIAVLQESEIVYRFDYEYIHVSWAHLVHKRIVTCRLFTIDVSNWAE